MDSSLLHKFSQLKFLAFDFDGVFTDNRVISDQFGNESVICSRSDGIGLTKLNNLGISTLVISTEKNPVVTKRCEKLKIRCMQGVNDKKDVFENFCSEANINLKDTAFVGNDINDLDDITIGEVNRLYSSIGEYLEPNSPTLDEDDSGASFGFDISSTETIDQEEFTWIETPISFTDSDATVYTNDSDSEVTLRELL